MKCEKCGKDMVLYKHAMHTHFEEKRWRCDCGNEFIEPFAREIPEPVEEVEPIKEKKAKK